MRILTCENNTYELDTLPDQIDDIRYCVLDASDSANVDYFYLPLVFLESFHAPAICLKIGPHNIQVPMDWSILVCDEEFTGVELIPLASLNNRGFHALIFNPFTDARIRGHDISITNIYSEVKWFFPKLKNGHVLALPLRNGDNPPCIYLVKDAHRVTDLHLSDVLCQ